MSKILLFEYVFVLLILILAVGINSQIRFSGDDDAYTRRLPINRPRQPASNCNCIEVQRCPLLFNRRDWRTTGETCGYGYGVYRRVCCHRTTGRRTPPIQPIIPERTVTTTAPVNRPRQQTPDCNCIEIRGCSLLRNQRNWRRAGENCGYGYGEYRRVCCPRTTGQRIPPIQPIIPERTVTTARPNPMMSTLVRGDCGRVMSGLKPLIMGGQNATEGMWPWMAAIRIRERTGIYTPWCTGFLIDSRHVMSAAHCFDTTNNDQYRARIGSVNQDVADEYRFTRIAVHEGYKKGQFYNDIAILTLDREVNFPNFNPICLPDEQVSNMDLTRQGTTVAGWGADKHRGQLKIHLQYLTRLPVITNSECTRRLRNILRDSYRRHFPSGVSRDLICAGFDEGGKDACGGDSGGPLMIMRQNRWYAIGIVSFGVKCGEPGQPGGYTKIASHLDWIRQNTRN